MEGTEKPLARVKLSYNLWSMRVELPSFIGGEAWESHLQLIHLTAQVSVRGDFLGNYIMSMYNGEFLLL